MSAKMADEADPGTDKFVAVRKENLVNVARRSKSNYFKVIVVICIVVLYGIVYLYPLIRN